MCDVVVCFVDLFIFYVYYYYDSFKDGIYLGIGNISPLKFSL